MKTIPLENGNYYHVYNRGNNSEDLFRENTNYLYFLELLKKYLLPVVDIYAYCLMSNHFHLLIRIKDDHDVQTDLNSARRSIGLVWGQSVF